MSKRCFGAALAFFVCVTAASADENSNTSTNGWKIIGWNDLGMHCMDGKDYSIYSILPPYNTIHAQVIDPSGKLVRGLTNLRVTYEAVADPTGSINRTTPASKTNFWQFAEALLGKKLPADAGLAGFNMPGPSNVPQAMKWEPSHNWFTAEGIPISPIDDAGRKNPYPMMRLKLLDSSNRVLAYTAIVLPVSDEMDCSACHKSGSPGNARPSSGWAFLNDPERDYKMNILRIHDDHNRGTAKYAAALQTAGYNAKGLESTVIENGKPVLCAGCHLSNALAPGQNGITPLTTAVHKGHANVIDPVTFLPLDSSDNRSACYRCHPGSETKCLRGAMGNAGMQCQSCHGNMSAVGAANRRGWFDEPTCQSCHTGTAAQNNGQIRYTSSFEASGAMRVPVNTRFASTPNTPLAGASLHRFSTGHGGLQCSACHGSTHAEYPSSHENDNLQSVQLQGHAGTLVECRACHSLTPSTVAGGPHGMHPVGAPWIDKHKDPGKQDLGQCRACHGLNDRGSVLSAMKATRTLKSKFSDNITLAEGTQVGCYNCHNGPRGGG